MTRKTIGLMRQALAADSARREDMTYAHDPHLSAEGNAAARRDQIADANAQFRASIANLLEAASDTAREVFNAAAAARPWLNENDTAALTRTAQAWQYTVLPRLERGESLAQILATASVDAVLATERFAPDYLSGPRGSGVNVAHYDATDDVKRAVGERLADMADTPDAAAAIMEAAHFHDDFDALHTIAELLDEGQGLQASMIVAQVAGESGAAPDAAAEGDPAA